MRILIYAPNYFPATRYGGPIRSTHGLAKGLVSLGCSVDVVTSNVDGSSMVDAPVETPVMLDEVSVRYCPLAFPKRLYRSPSMQRIFRDEIKTYDAVHVNGVYLWPGPALASAARHAGVPYVVSPRGMLVPEMIAGRSTMVKRGWIAAFERRVLASARAIHVTSREEAEGVRQLGLDLAPLAILGNGVDPPHPGSPVADQRIWADVPRGRRLAFLARLDWTKGMDHAIQATARVPDARLLLAGPDQIGLRAELERKIPNDSNGPIARFLGPLEDAEKWELLRGADVVLVPSVKESFGMSAAEALAVGTPVVCTPGVGLSDIVRMLDAPSVAERNVDAIAKSIARLLEDPALRRRYGEDAHRLMTEEFGWSNIAARMLAIYQNK